MVPDEQYVAEEITIEVHMRTVHFLRLPTRGHLH